MSRSLSKTGLALGLGLHFFPLVADRGEQLGDHLFQRRVFDAHVFDRMAGQDRRQHFRHRFAAALAAATSAASASSTSP